MQRSRLIQRIAKLEKSISSRNEPSVVVAYLEGTLRKSREREGQQLPQTLDDKVSTAKFIAWLESLPEVPNEPCT